MKSMRLNLALAAALATALVASPVEAQKGKGNGNDKHEGRGRVEARDRDGDRDARRRTSTRVERRDTRRVPPGWCQGRGNPHNTAANCGYHTDQIRRDRDGIWRDRYGNRISTRAGIYRDVSGVLRDHLGRALRF